MLWLISVYSLCFDILKASTDYSSHWKLVRNDLSSITESIFQHLELSRADKERWAEDEDEYLRSNLALESMDASIDEVESFTARKSAVDFLEAISKYVEDIPQSKVGGKKGRKKGKGKPSSKVKRNISRFELHISFETHVVPKYLEIAASC